MATDDQFDLEEIENLNAIDARWFLPFLIHRLKPIAVERSVVAELSLQNLPDQIQLLTSRHSVAGFVSVTRFRPLNSILSFHSKR